MGKSNTIILMALIFSLGLAFYIQQKNRMESQAEKSLVAVAELKAKQITDWREERLNDAAALSDGPFLRDLVTDFLESTDHPPAPQLIERFSSFKRNFKCSDILILDPVGNVRFSLVNERPFPIIEESKKDLFTALETGNPLLTELHFDVHENNPHIGVIAPIIGENGPIAAVVLHSDATEFLYPLIHMWPYPSESAETILVRRDGDSVLYLNNLRFKNETALKLRVPLDTEEVPAVLAVKGKEGIYSGRDYRGVEVISALKHIPDSDWYIETKIDRAEALSEWHDRANILWLLILFILASVVAGAGFAAQRTSKKHYKSLFMAESTLRENLERYRVTMRSIGDAVIGTDAQGRVRMMNPVAETLTGWSEQDAIGKMLEDVFRIVNEYTHEPVVNPVRRVVQEGKIIGLANHTMLIARDGQERPIADSAAPILDDENNIIGTVLIFRDQTEERETQEALVRSERFLRRRMELIDFAHDHSIHDILQKTLDIIGEETDSPIGFYHSVDVDQKNLTLQAWSTKTVKEFCKAEGHGMHYGIEQAGVWVDCVRERRPVIHNDYASLPHRKGLPEGHAPVIRELVVPVMREDLIVAIVGIGNKPIVYSEKDVDFAKFFADVSWELVLRKTSEEQLRKNEAALSRSQQIAHVGSWELDVTQNRLEWSDETYRIFGIAPNAFPATYEAFLDMVHPEDKKLVDAAYSNSLRDEKDGYEIGHRIVRKDNGETRHVIEKCIHERDSHGQIIRSVGMVQDITRRRLMEKSLRESEEFFKRMFMDAPIGIELYDKSGVFQTANDKCLEILGIQSASAIKNFNLFEDPNVTDEMKSRLRCGQTVRYEHEFSFDIVRSHSLYETGRTGRIWIDVLISPLVIDEELNGYLVHVEEITERKEAQEAIVAANKKLDALWRISSLQDADLQTISDHILETIGEITNSKYGFYGFINQDESAMTIHSWSGNAMSDCAMGNKPAEFPIIESGIWAEAVRRREPFILNNYDSAVDGKKGLPEGHVQITNLMVVPHFTGDRITAVAAVANRYIDYSDDDVNHITTFLNSVQAITDAKRTEDALRESEQQNRTILKTAIDGFILLDNLGKVTSVNEAYCRMSGYREEELLGLKAQDVEGVENASETAERMKTLATSGKGLFETKHKRKDGSLFDVEVSVTYLPDHGGQFVAFIRDITRRKKAQEDLINSETRVRTKLEAVLSPEGDIGNLELSDIINSEAVQSIMNEFYSLTGIGVGVIDMNGNVLAATGWQDICTKFHRIHPETCRNCVESDTKLSVGVNEGEFKEYKCKNGMWDLSTPLIVGGKHLGNIFLGQFLYEDESTEYEFFRTQARKYGFDEEEYIAALDRVPRWSREMTANAMDFYAKLGGMISTLSYSNFKLARAIEERKEIDARMKMMAEMLDEAPNSITVHDTKGNFLFANTKTAEMHGYAEQEFMAINLHQHDVPESEALIEERLKLIAKNGEASFETAHFRKDGTFLPLHVFAKKVTWGNVPAILSVATDITERKMAQEELKASEKRFMDVLYSSSDAILLIGDNIFIDCNEATAKMLGYDTREEFLQTHPSKLSPPVQPDGRSSFEKAEEMMHTAFDKGFHRFEWIHRRASGEDFPVEVSLTPIVHKGKSLLYCVWRDITVQKRMEEEKKKLQAQLYQAQKMEAIGQLAGGMAHDFNNMLGVIMSAAELAKLDIKEDSPAREELEAINDAVKRARELTMKLLTFARKDKINVRKAEMNTLLNDLHGLLKRTVPKSIDITVNVKDNSVINCDGNQIQQALVNVCNNAVDAMPSGGKLLIEATAVKVEEGICPDCGKGFTGGYALIQISDTGIGMTRDTIAKITEPFFTTKGIGKGTGLGLSVSLGIVHSHQGHLHVYSEPDKGTCIKIYLPLGGATADSDESRAPEISFKGTETILVVDDEEHLLRLAGKMLSRNGYKPLLAGDGDTAIELYKKHLDEISVVVLDLMMPGMDGAEVNRRLKDLNPDVKIVFSSGFSADGMASELLKDKHHGFVQKPFEMNTLCREIRAQIEEA